MSDTLAELVSVRMFLSLRPLRVRQDDLENFCTAGYEGTTSESTLCSAVQAITQWIYFVCPTWEVPPVCIGEEPFDAGSFIKIVRRAECEFLNRASRLRDNIIKDVLVNVTPNSGDFFDSLVDTIEATDAYLANPYQLLYIVSEDD